jgi:hypothetical protein
MTKHLRNGNCFDFIFSCNKCGRGNPCDVCHLHEEPRGECSLCALCAECKVEIVGEEVEE